MKIEYFITVIGGATAALARPVSERSGSTIFMVGQNYYDEWQDFQSSMGKTPAGISVYGDIYDGLLNSDSQNELSSYAASYNGYVEVGMSWKDDMTNHGYTQYQGAQLCDDIAAGKWDSGLNTLGSYLAKFPNVQYILRVDYEVSGNLHANTNPTEFDESTWDLTAYPKAFAHVREVLGGLVPKISFMYHPVRGEASLLYPGDSVVDYQGFSIFNNDVCLPVADTTNCDGEVLDPNVIKDIQFATKPKWVAESAVQPPASGSSDDFITYLTRVTNMVETYGFAGWTYINSDWPAHGWGNTDWGDSRVQEMPSVKSWFNTNVITNGAYIFG